MQEDINEILGITKSSNTTGQYFFDLAIAAFVISLIAIPFYISCLLMVNHDPSGLNPVIKDLKPFTYYAGMVISAFAFLLGVVALFMKRTSKKFAILTMITCVLSVLAFFVLAFLNLMHNWPA